MSEVHQFPCAQCGAFLEFSPTLSALACQSCGYRHEAVHHLGEIAEHDYFATLRQVGHDALDVHRLATACGACGAQFEMPENVHAGNCPYCDSPAVHDPGEQRQIPVHAVLPFAITAEAGRAAFKRWIKGLWFAPSALARFARQDRDLTGTYLPHWTYDSQTYTRYVGERGDTYMVPVREQVQVNGRWEERTRMETRVRWSPAAGAVRVAFDDVVVSASDSVPAPVIEHTGSWPLGQLHGYRHELLSGFTSALYSKRLEDGFAEARELMRPVIHDAIRGDIGGDLQRIHDTATDHHEVRFKHVLLPLWLAAFRFRDKVYRFAVNGVTGQVHGERPYSPWKIGFAVLGALVVLALVMYVTSSAP